MTEERKKENEIERYIGRKREIDQRENADKQQKEKEKENRQIGIDRQRRDSYRYIEGEGMGLYFPTYVRGQEEGGGDSFEICAIIGKRKYKECKFRERQLFLLLKAKTGEILRLGDSPTFRFNSVQTKKNMVKNKYGINVSSTVEVHKQFM